MSFTNIGLTAEACLNALLSQCDAETGTDWIPAVSTCLSEVALVRTGAEFRVLSIRGGYMLRVQVTLPEEEDRSVDVSIPIALGAERILKEILRRFRSYARHVLSSPLPEPEPAPIPVEHLRCLHWLHVVSADSSNMTDRRHNERKYFCFRIESTDVGIDVKPNGRAELEVPIPIGPSAVQLIDRMCATTRKETAV